VTTRSLLLTKTGKIKHGWQFPCRVLLPQKLGKSFMKKEVSIVLSPEEPNHRKLAQEWYGLTSEQMVDMDVHHNPPRSQGGRNIPEHLFVYHKTLHTAVHDDDFVQWARKGGQIGGKVGGKKNAEAKTGVCNPKVREKGLQTQREKQTGFFDREGQKRRAQKAGIKTYQLGVGVHHPDNLGKGGRVSAVRGVGFHTPENRANCKNKPWWVTEQGKTCRSTECPGQEWQRGRKWRPNENGLFF